MKKRSLLMLAILGIFGICLFTGCGTGEQGGASAPAPGKVPTAARLGLGTDAVTVKSDDSTSATITVTALDASNAAVEGVPVSFTATGGALSSSSLITDAKGKALVAFSSGTLDQRNQVVTVTASASGVSAQIPIQIVGSTLTLTSTTTNVPSDGSTSATLTVIAKNAGNVPLRNAAVTLTVAGAGSVSLSAAAGTTDINGKLRDAAGKEITVTGTRAGIATVTAQGLGTTAPIDYTVTGPAVGVFSITAPAADPASCSTAATISVEVTVPDPVATPNVTFATSLGVWDGAAAIRTKAVNPATMKATATLSSPSAGSATIQVYDPLKPTTLDSAGITFYAPATSAAKISLQSDATVVGLSVGGIFKTTTLRATVRSASNEPVGDAPVIFSLANTTGGGEFVSPLIAYTDTTGLAKTTFTSGSISTGALGSPIEVNATVVGTAPPVTTAQPVKIIIGETSGSVTIGRGTLITKLTPTTYSLPMSVLVADSSGAPVGGAVVSLKLWPVSYSSGVWYNSIPYDPQNPNKVLYKPWITGTFPNDDKNENLIRDPGEGSDAYGALRPPNSAAGDIPATVTTDANGVANFNWIYLKDSAEWITGRITATTRVQGTETSSSAIYLMVPEKEEAEGGFLHNSANPIELTVPRSTSITYNLPFWVSPYGPTTYAISSIYSSIVSGPPVVYTFNAPATPGIYNDFISASDGGTTSAMAWVRILVQ